MPFNAQVLNVLIASPGDTLEARDVVERSVRLWNADRSRERATVLVPLRWEIDATAELGDDGQSVINRQLVERSDIVIGIFDSRLGGRTARSLSGTVEELETSLASGARVHVFFSEMHIRRDVDPDQLKALREFRVLLSGKGLLGTYESFEQLAVRVRSALERDVDELPRSLVSPAGARAANAPAGEARLQITAVLDRAGTGETHDTSACRVEIENVGSATARDLYFRIDAVGSGEAPLYRASEIQERDLEPGRRYSFQVYRNRLSVLSCNISVTWREGDSVFFASQVVKLC